MHVTITVNAVSADCRRTNARLRRVCVVTRVLAILGRRVTPGNTTLLAFLPLLPLAGRTLTHLCPEYLTFLVSRFLINLTKKDGYARLCLVSAISKMNASPAVNP